MMYVSDPKQLKMVERLLEANPNMIAPLAELMVWNYYNDREKYDRIMKEFGEKDEISLLDVDYTGLKQGLSFSHTEIKSNDTV